MKSYDTFLSLWWNVIIPTHLCLLHFISRQFPFSILPAAAHKTQPYDLLRWSAAYFRCLSMDVLPPVKPRYEHENIFGCLTKGYLKVLLSQVRGGVFWGEGKIPCHVLFYIFQVSIWFLLPFTLASIKLWFMSFDLHEAFQCFLMFFSGVWDQYGLKFEFSKKKKLFSKFLVKTFVRWETLTKTYFNLILSNILLFLLPQETFNKVFHSTWSYFLHPQPIFTFTMPV